MTVKKPLVIGIAGGTCSGKSSIAKILIKEFDNKMSVNIIKEDDYYKDQTALSMEERAKTNYDHPLAFDFDLMIDRPMITQYTTVLKLQRSSIPVKY